jgi:galactokinase
MTGPTRRVHAPGRVNLIGDHVDYMDGVVLPMAIDLGTTIEVRPSEQVLLRSADEADDIVLELPVDDPSSVSVSWGRYVAAVLAEMGTVEGFAGTVTSTLPIGAGMSSSSSLSVAVALAAGFDGSTTELARLCRRAETVATGVPCGIMDQLTICAASAGAALRIDCRDETYGPVRLPDQTVVHAVHSGVTRRLAGSEYAERRDACEAAQAIVGPLRDVSIGDTAAIDDPVLRARARHVVSEIARVEAAIEAADQNDAATFGALMVESHESLRDDFEVSIPELDSLVERLCAIPGVHGARITGAGFGGCVVALVDEAVDADVVGGWRVRPSEGAHVL